MSKEEVAPVLWFSEELSAELCGFSAPVRMAGVSSLRGIQHLYSISVLFWHWTWAQIVHFYLPS